MFYLQARKGQGRVQPCGQRGGEQCVPVSQERACLVGRTVGGEVGLDSEGGGVGRGGEVT